MPFITEEIAQHDRFIVLDRKTEQDQEQNCTQQPQQIFHEETPLVRGATITYAGKKLAAPSRDRPPIRYYTSLSETGWKQASALPVINPFPQLLARLEVRHILGRHLHLVARLGIASQAGRPVVQGKAAETADFDTTSLGQGGRHAVEDYLDSQLGILGQQLRITLCKFDDEIRTGHGRTLCYASAL